MSESGAWTCCTLGAILLWSKHGGCLIRVSHHSVEFRGRTTTVSQSIASRKLHCKPSKCIQVGLFGTMIGMGFMHLVRDYCPEDCYDSNVHPTLSKLCLPLSCHPKAPHAAHSNRRWPVPDHPCPYLHPPPSLILISILILFSFSSSSLYCNNIAIIAIIAIIFS